MDAVFNYEIPVLHPLAVHFPLVLLLTAALTCLVWAFLGRPFWRRTSLLLVLLGTAGAFFAYFTGDIMEEQSEGVPIVDELVDLHETMGLYTLVAACIVSAILTGVSFVQDRRGGPEARLSLRVAIACLMCIAAALVAWTAHVGATMTWGVAAIP